MNFEQLQTLLTVANSKNYRQGSKKLHISTREAHKQINSLEEELSFQLINEDEHGNIELTRYGKEVVGYASQLVNKQQEMIHLLHDIEKANGNNRIVLGSSLPVKLTEYYKEYRRMHPGLKVQYTDLCYVGLAKLLLTQIDILECEKNTFPDSIEFLELGHAPLQVFVSSNNDLFLNKSLSISDLKNYKVYLTKSDSSVIESLIQLLNNEAISYEILDGNDYTIFKACDKDSVYIQEPLGIPSYATIKLLPLDDTRLTYTYGLAYLKDSPCIVKDLIESIAKQK